MNYFVTARLGRKEVVMVLENLLRSPWELTRYRRPPLSLELDGFCQWLHTQGYSRSVRSHLSNISQLNQYLRFLEIKDCREVQKRHDDRFIGQHLRKRGRVASRHRTCQILKRFLSVSICVNLRVSAVNFS